MEFRESLGTDDEVPQSSGGRSRAGRAAVFAASGRRFPALTEFWVVNGFMVSRSCVVVPTASIDSHDPPSNSLGFCSTEQTAPDSLSGGRGRPRGTAGRRRGGAGTGCSRFDSTHPSGVSRAEGLARGGVGGVGCGGLAPYNSFGSPAALGPGFGKSPPRFSSLEAGGADAWRRRSDVRSSVGTLLVVPHFDASARRSFTSCCLSSPRSPCFGLSTGRPVKPSRVLQADLQPDRQPRRGRERRRGAASQGGKGTQWTVPVHVEPSNSTPVGAASAASLMDDVLAEDR